MRDGTVPDADDGESQSRARRQKPSELLGPVLKGKVARPLSSLQNFLGQGDESARGGGQGGRGGRESSSESLVMGEEAADIVIGAMKKVWRGGGRGFRAGS